MKMPKKNLVASMACVSSFMFAMSASSLVGAVEALSDGELQQSYLSIVTASKAEEPVKKAENKCQTNADENANIQQDLVRNKKHQSACGEGGGDGEEDEEKEKLSAKDKKKTSKQKNKDDKSSDNEGESAKKANKKANKDTDDVGDSDSKTSAKAVSKSKSSSKNSSGAIAVSDLESTSDDEGLAALGVKSANNSGAGKNLAGANIDNSFVAGNDLDKQSASAALDKARDDILGTDNSNDRQSIEQIQKQLNDLQNAKISSDGTGTTVTISKPGTINFDYLYRSINGGGINKGTDIEIPSIRAGYTELKIRTYK